jgi:hypothetical protein
MNEDMIASAVVNFTCFLFPSKPLISSDLVIPLNSLGLVIKSKCAAAGCCVSSKI